jgi:hypothetical protein
MGPDRAARIESGPGSRRKAITMESVMVDAIRMRAHARPLDEPESS